MSQQTRNNQNAQAQQQYMAQQSQLNFTEPPDVKVIEASCKQSNRKTPDNSEWTNVLADPILVRKGSEIKCLSTFIDAPGIDQEIIQFTRSGSEQDNTHCLVSQMYTVNDGFQNKTTSYDYMSRSDSGNVLIMNPGGSYAGITLAPLAANHIYIARQIVDGAPRGDICQIKGAVLQTKSLQS